MTRHFRIDPELRFDLLRIKPEQRANLEQLYPDLFKPGELTEEQRHVLRQRFPDLFGPAAPPATGMEEVFEPELGPVPLGERGRSVLGRYLEPFTAPTPPVPSAAVAPVTGLPQELALGTEELPVPLEAGRTAMMGATIGAPLGMLAGQVGLEAARPLLEHLPPRIELPDVTQELGAGPGAFPLRDTAGVITFLAAAYATGAGIRFVNQVFKAAPSKALARFDAEFYQRMGRKLSTAERKVVFNVIRSKPEFKRAVMRGVRGEKLTEAEQALLRDAGIDVERIQTITGAPREVPKAPPARPPTPTKPPPPAPPVSLVGHRVQSGSVTGQVIEDLGTRLRVRADEPLAGRVVTVPKGPQIKVFPGPPKPIDTPIEAAAKQEAAFLADTLEQVSEATPTGKLIPTEAGQFIRVKGFKKMFESLRGLKATPGEIVAAIRRDKNDPLYLEIVDRIKAGLSEGDIRAAFAETELAPTEEAFESFSQALDMLAKEEAAALVKAPPKEPEKLPGPPTITTTTEGIRIKTAAPGAAREIFDNEAELVRRGLLKQEEIPLLRRTTMDAVDRANARFGDINVTYAEIYPLLLRRALAENISPFKVERPAEPAEPPTVRTEEGGQLVIRTPRVVPPGPIRPPEGAPIKPIEELPLFEPETPEQFEMLEREIHAHNQRMAGIEREETVIRAGDVERGFMNFLSGRGRQRQPLIRGQILRFFINKWKRQKAQEDAKVRRAEKEMKKHVKDPKIIMQGHPKDYGWFSTLGTPSNVLRRYGPIAERAIKTLVMAEIKQRIMYGKRQERDLEVANSISVEEFGKHGEIFWDIFEDKPIEDILARTDISEATKDAARYFRKKFDFDRENLMIPRMREEKRASVRARVEKRLRKEITIPEFPLGARRRTPEQLEEIKQRLKIETEEELRREVPDTWGIRNYLPHILPGDFKLFKRVRPEIRAEEEAGRLIVEPPDEWVRFETARTRMEAWNKIAKDHVETDASADDYLVDVRMFVHPDITRVSQKRRWLTINRLAKALEIDKDDVADGLKGILGTKERKAKFAAPLQRRKGYPGYTKDFKWMLSLYNASITRWIHITDAAREVRPLIEQLRKEGLENLADEIDVNLQMLWGYKSKASKLLDASLEQAEGIKELHRPYALERWANRVKGASAHMFLTLSARFHFLNSLQTIQTLLPIVKGRGFVDGLKLYWGTEIELPGGEVLRGKEILDRHGVRFLVGGKFLGEAGLIPRVRTAKIREKMGIFAPETFNQEFAFLAMYLKARRMGMNDKQAAEFGFLRGNVYSQFLGLVTDQPRALYRSLSTGLTSPVKSTIFQFRRFQVKDIEILLDLIRQRDVTGVALWTGAHAAVGGLKGLTNPLIPILGGSYITLEVYNAIKDEYGETVANLIAYGLPSFIGMDFSYSLQLVDVPFGRTVPEAVGNVILGPIGSLVVTGARGAFGEKAEKGVIPSRLERSIRALTERAPGLRWIEGIRRLAKGDYDFYDPQGRLKFKADLKDVLLHMAGFRTLTAAHKDMLLNAYYEVERRRYTVIDRAAQVHARMRLGYEVTSEQIDEAMSAVQQWNELFGDIAVIAFADITRRADERVEATTVPRLERIIRGGPRALRKDIFLGGVPELTEEQQEELRRRYPDIYERR